MTAQDLIEQLDKRDIWVRLRDGRVILESVPGVVTPADIAAAAPLTEALRAYLAEPAPEKVAAAPEWSAQDCELIDWFMHNTALPPESFILADGVHVTKPYLWYRSLQRDILDGPRGPCARGVIADLTKLRKVLG